MAERTINHKTSYSNPELDEHYRYAYREFESHIRVGISNVEKQWEYKRDRSSTLHQMGYLDAWGDWELEQEFRGWALEIIGELPAATTEGQIIYNKVDGCTYLCSKGRWVKI